MDLSTYIDEIKLELSGGVLDLELDDNEIEKIITSSVRELARYIDTTIVETIPYSKCIDLSPRKVNAVVSIRRADTINGTGTGTMNALTDPIAVTAYQVLNNGGLYNFGRYMNNVEAWSLTQQIRNTLSTDLAYFYDHEKNQLYINVSQGIPDKITIEYVPRFDCVDDIRSEFWSDILMQMALAKTKIILGRIRTKYTSSNSLWTLDGATILEEGKTELQALRDKLQSSSQLAYPID